jgi:thioredoxin 1
MPAAPYFAFISVGSQLKTFPKVKLNCPPLAMFRPGRQVSFKFKPMPKKSFTELINSPGMPVLVDFYADWCGPCKTMAPILQQIAGENAGKVKIIKIDVDRNQPVAQQYRVQSIPTLILFHQGKVLWRQAGVVPAGQLNQVLKQYAV